MVECLPVTVDPKPGCEGLDELVDAMTTMARVFRVAGTIFSCLSPDEKQALLSRVVGNVGMRIPPIALECLVRALEYANGGEAAPSSAGAVYAKRPFVNRNYRERHMAEMVKAIGKSKKALDQIVNEFINGGKPVEVRGASI